MPFRHVLVAPPLPIPPWAYAKATAHLAPAIFGKLRSRSPKSDGAP